MMLPQSGGYTFGITFFALLLSSLLRYMPEASCLGLHFSGYRIVGSIYPANSTSSRGLS
jgi:hypothetical protein